MLPQLYPDRGKVVAINCEKISRKSRGRKKVSTIVGRKIRGRKYPEPPRCFGTLSRLSLDAFFSFEIFLSLDVFLDANLQGNSEILAQDI